MEMIDYSATYIMLLDMEKLLPRKSNHLGEEICTIYTFKEAFYVRSNGNGPGCNKTQGIHAGE